MICLGTVKSYCKEYWRIENYEKAITDTTQTWHCHHILEQVFTRKQLIVGGNYYNVEPECLIFLASSEHYKMPHKGRKRSEETKAKIGAGYKGMKHTNDSKEKIRKAKLGKKLSEEHKRKISDALKGRKMPLRSEEWKRKQSISQKGRHWYNNGEKAIQAFECPEGFVRGRLR